MAGGEQGELQGWAGEFEQLWPARCGGLRTCLSLTVQQAVLANFRTVDFGWP
jgi:hypothetical protein